MQKRLVRRKSEDPSIFAMRVFASMLPLMDERGAVAAGGWILDIARDYAKRKKSGAVYPEGR